VIESLSASETSFGSPALTTIAVDVQVKYQNRVFKANTYVFPYNQDELEHPDFIL
jgi:hypothetical protein